MLCIYKVISFWAAILFSYYRPARRASHFERSFPLSPNPLHIIGYMYCGSNSEPQQQASHTFTRIKSIFEPRPNTDTYVKPKSGQQWQRTTNDSNNKKRKEKKTLRQNRHRTTSTTASSVHSIRTHSHGLSLSRTIMHGPWCISTKWYKEIDGNYRTLEANAANPLKYLRAPNSIRSSVWMVLSYFFVRLSIFLLRLQFRSFSASSLPRIWTLIVCAWCVWVCVVRMTVLHLASTNVISYIPCIYLRCYAREYYPTSN